MNLRKLKPSKSLNKAYYKQSLSREQIELFKKELQNTFNHIDEKQDEEYHKNVIADLFKNVYCKDKYLVNVNKKEDLVIRVGNSTKEDVGVLLEFKKPTEKRDMVSAENANVKALQELVLYYLRQTVDTENHKITNIVVTNIYEWFIFDGVWFEKNIFRNNKLKKDYLAFKNSGHDTKYFYETIAAKHLSEFTEEVPCTYFNLLDYKEKITNDNPNDDEDLIDLYKILSPEHLLNKKFANDSNSLNTDFYNELLYIIGLEESKETAKKTIRRINEAERNPGSLIENTISKLKTKKYFGFDTTEEAENQYYEVALELCITWLNRILFLKLLESQLIKYHRGDTENYSFLTIDKITDFDELEELFFEVLAEKVADRNPSITAKYKDIPYLNSSLFEMTDLEKNALALSNLKDRLTFPIYKKSVLKKGTKEEIKPKTSLKYLLEFLDAYNFASESNAKIQEENKSIINASVLGLIFEKINGYKDGSFFTPGFITMYMCRETIRKAVVEKFKNHFPKCENIVDFDELKDKIDYTNKAHRETANKLINDIKIVDPAVGSGHFLVSALNEMIAIKSDLQILSYTNGDRVKGYTITLDNDELIIQNQETDKLFEYTLNQNNNIIPDLQELQNCLFTEKQILIENCLFGVDINPKSVMICQLRLWIELLKNAYYTKESDYKELHTLPNIDINIKTGNSLISKFAIKDNVFENVAGFQNKLQEYKNWVHIYKNEMDKGAKHVLKKKITSFKDEFNLVDKRIKDIEKKITQKSTEILLKYKSDLLFNSDLDEKQKVAKQKLEKELQQLIDDKNNILSNPIYANAFEWRFEFPEVLDNNGDFIGFDVVIGNPPYFVLDNSTIEQGTLNYYKTNKNYNNAQGGKLNAYKIFLSLAPTLLVENGLNSQIFQISFLGDNQAKKIREYYLYEQKILRIDAFPERDNENKRVFEEAKMSVCILFSQNKKLSSYDFDLNISYEKAINQNSIQLSNEIITAIDFETKAIPIANKNEIELLIKIQKNKKKLKDIIKCYQGELNISVHKEFFQTEKTEYLLVKGVQVQKYFITDKPSQGVIEYVIKEKYIKENSSPKSKHYQFERIIMQGITGVNEKNRIKATLLKSKSFCGHSTNYMLVDKFTEIEKYFILGLLNSKLYNWIFKITSTNSNVNSYEIENLPIIDVDEKVSKLVNQILTLKKENPQADTSKLEEEIDELVFQLYELTPEEIEVVKKS